MRRFVVALLATIMVACQPQPCFDPDSTPHTRGLPRDRVQVVRVIRVPAIVTRVLVEVPVVVYRPPKPYPRFEAIIGKLHSGMPITGDIVTFRDECRLDAGEVASLRHVEASLGYLIRFSGALSCFRTYAQQAAIYADRPGLAAPPGHSLHEKGLALDVTNVDERMRWMLYLHGWSQFNRALEPWHFSYRTVG